MKPILQDGKFAITFENVQKQEVKKLIKDVASDFQQAVSTNDILSAMALKKSVEIQKDDFGDELYLTILIDVRRNVKEYGPKFFGSGIMIHDVDYIFF